MGSKRKKYTVGYKYFLGLHGVIAKPVDKLLAIKVDGKIFWEGDVSANTTLSFDNPEFFDSSEIKDGIVGDVDIEFGAAAQVANSYLSAHQSGAAPAYRGVLGIVWNKLYYGNSAIARPWTFKLQNTSALDTSFKTAKAAITDAGTGWVSMNAAHILRDIAMLNQRDDIDTTIFGTTWDAVADTLYTEGFGLSFDKRGGGSLDSFKQEVEKHIDGIVYADRATGLLEIKLFRDDYVAAELPVFNDGNAVFSNIVWPDPKEATNQFTVIWTNPEKDGENGSVTMTNTARVAQVGRVNRDQDEFLGITTRALASQVCQRELRRRSVAPMSGEMRVHGLSPDINVGDVVVVNSTRFGVSNSVVRISNIEEAGSRSNEAVITFAEDVFSLGESVAIGDTSPTPTDKTPQAADPVVVEEMPYYVAIVGTDTEDADVTADEDLGFLNIAAGRASGIHINYDIQVDEGGGYSKTGEGDFAEYAYLDGAISKTDTAITIKNASGLWAPATNDIILIGSEYCRIDSGAGASWTIGRGCLDTVPQEHADNTAIMLPRAPETDDVEYAAAQSVDVKLLTRTSSGTLAIGDATAETVVFDNRMIRPYPPGKFQIEASYTSSGIKTGSLAGTWAHRDRLTQTSLVIEDHTYGDIGPEAGTTYVPVRYIIDDGGARRGPYAVSAAQAGTSYSFSADDGDLFDAADIFDLSDIFDNAFDENTASIELGARALRGGHYSWTTPTIEVQPLLSPISLTATEV